MLELKERIFFNVSERESEEVLNYVRLCVLMTKRVSIPGYDFQAARYEMFLAEVLYRRQELRDVTHVRINGCEIEVRKANDRCVLEFRRSTSE